MHWPYWLYPIYWEYILQPRDRLYGVSWWTVIRCRMKVHPCGVVWYTHRLEPNMHCKNCGDDLG
jgi:hypothetical protein